MPGRCTFTTTASPVEQAAAVHLTDRRRRERLPVELREHRLDRGAELVFEELLDLGPVGRRDVVLQQPELVDHGRGQQVGPCRQDLAELHEHVPGVLERAPHAHRHRARARRSASSSASPRDLPKPFRAAMRVIWA